MSVFKQKNLSLIFSTYLILTLSFTVVMIFSLLSVNINTLLTKWGQDTQVIVYLTNNISTLERERIEKFVTSDPIVAEVSFVSKEKALEDFQSQLAGFSSDLSNDEILNELLPQSLHLTIKKQFAEVSGQIDQINILSNKIKSFSGVEEVQFGEAWLKEYASIANTTYSIIAFFVFVILFSTGFIISNLIRALTESKKMEIEVLEMIGASYWLIRKPFLINSFSLSVIASLFSLAFTYSVYHVVIYIFQATQSLTRLSMSLSFFSLGQSLFLIFTFITISMLSAYWSVKNINTGWAAKDTKHA